MEKNLVITFGIMIIFSFAANGQKTSPGTSRQFASAGYWLFGDESGTFHNAFLRYETLVVQNKINISLMPHAGITRKSYGGAIGVKYVAGAKKKSNFLVGHEFHTWVQDETYYEKRTVPDPTSHPKREVHQTTKGAITLDVGFRRSFNRVFLTGFAQLGTVVFNSFEKKAERLTPPIQKEKNIVGGIIPGVYIGTGYRF